MNHRLPLPPPHALAISALLTQRIVEEIEKNHGWISFARYMELALYAPGLGYYSGGAAKLGGGFKDGSDFTTAPELTPLFARALAQQVAQILALSAPYVLEFGAGSGKLAADLLLELERLDALPERYAILDVSADLRQRQAQTISERVPHLMDRVVWLELLPEVIDGAIIGNEVLDAMPVHLIVKSNDQWLERGVALDASQGFIFCDRPGDASAASWSKSSIHSSNVAAIHQRLYAAIEFCVPSPQAMPHGYVSEINLAATAFVATLAQRLGKGAALFIDYGFPQHEYYHPQRSSGSLMMHYRHHVHADPFLWPGLQDITAHVDFSAVAHAAADAGADILGYLDQANFLINCGIVHLIEGSPENAEPWLRQTNALQTLVSEAEMGELFKVLAFGKGIALPLLSFTKGKRLDKL